jgi:hypothetical protein
VISFLLDPTLSNVPLNPKPRFRRFPPNNLRIPDHLLQARPHGRDPLRIDYPVRHGNNYTKPYDSYRPKPQTRLSDRPNGEPLLGRISGGGGPGGGRRRKKIPQLERRE